jgi:hypothetical protein
VILHAEQVDAVRLAGVTWLASYVPKSTQRFSGRASMQEQTQPNNQLIAVMDRYNCTRGGLARRVRMLAAQRGEELKTDHVTVKKWCDGAMPRPATVELIATALTGMTGERITPAMIGMETAGTTGLGDALEYPQNVTESITRLGSLARRDLSGDPQLVDRPASAEALTQPMLLWMLARPDSGNEGSGSGARVTPADVEAVRQTIRMFLSLDFRYGGGHARAALAQFFAQDVMPLLGGSYSAEVGQALFAAAAEAAELLGWTAYDLGRHGMAQRYLIQSLRLAQAGNDRTLAARVMASLSHQANYLGHFQAAAQLARAAQEGAKSTATPAVMAMFLAMEARAMAGAGDPRATSAILCEAERAFARSDPASEPEWISYFDDAELAGEAAHCFRDLRVPLRTQEFVTRAIETTAPAYVRTLAFVRLVHAASLVHQETPEEAVHVASAVIDDCGPLKSARYLRYIRDLQTELTPFSQVPAVQAFNALVSEKYPSINVAKI